MSIESDRQINRVLVRIYNENKKWIQGAGVLVSDRHILTCAHVVEEALDHEPGDRQGPADIQQAQGPFDVFLCHNKEDKPAVKEIGEQLNTDFHEPDNRHN